MKIVQVGPFPTDINCIKGGVESSVYGTSVALANQHEVKVFDFPRLNCLDIVENIDNLTIYRYKNPGLLSDPKIHLQMLKDNKLEAQSYKWSTIAQKIVELYKKL